MPRTSTHGASLPRAAVLGFAAGLRTFTPLAALAVRGRLGGGQVVRRGALLVAASEWIGDKSSRVPARTSPGPLIGRAVSGAVVGTVVGGRRGGVVGALGAIAGSYAGCYGRAALGRATGKPDALFAIAEDGLTTALSAWASRQAA
jgi:uncharacterized membrane protein